MGKTLTSIKRVDGTGGCVAITAGAVVAGGGLPAVTGMAGRIMCKKHLKINKILI